jgi:hypothetical protein
MLNTNSETRIGPATVIVVVQLPFSWAIWLEKAYLVRMKTISPAASSSRSLNRDLPHITAGMMSLATTEEMALASEELIAIVAAEAALACGWRYTVAARWREHQPAVPGLPSGLLAIIEDRGQRSRPGTPAPDARRPEAGQAGTRRAADGAPDSFPTAGLTIARLSC